MMKKRIAAIALALMLALSLAACKQPSKGFYEATGIDLTNARIKIAEYGENDGTGRYSSFTISEDTLNGLLSPITVDRGKEQNTMPDQFFFFHLALSNEETTEIVIGCYGEVIVGNPDSRNFWIDTEKAAYQQLQNYFAKESMAREDMTKQLAAALKQYENVRDVTIDAATEPVTVAIAVAEGIDLSGQQKENIEQAVGAAFLQFEIEYTTEKS